MVSGTNTGEPQAPAALTRDVATIVVRDVARNGNTR